MRLFRHSFPALLIFALLGTLAPLGAHAADGARLRTITPVELLSVLQPGQSAQPLLWHVGSHMLYVQAHIPGSEYLGAGSTGPGIQNLRKRASGIPKNRAIVLYCGCCPWSHCPNVNPAYDALRQMGFTKVKVLYLANNFGADHLGLPITFLIDRQGRIASKHTGATDASVFETEIKQLLATP